MSADPAFDVNGAIDLAEQLLTFIAPTLSVLFGLLVGLWIVDRVIDAIRNTRPPAQS